MDFDENSLLNLEGENSSRLSLLIAMKVKHLKIRTWDETNFSVALNVPT